MSSSFDLITDSISKNNVAVSRRKPQEYAMGDIVGQFSCSIYRGFTCNVTSKYFQVGEVRFICCIGFESS